MKKQMVEEARSHEDLVKEHSGMKDVLEQVMQAKEAVEAQNRQLIEQIEQNDEQHRKICSRCKKEVEEGHRFEFIEDTATCEQAGEELSRCLDCGYEKHEPSEKLNHTPVIQHNEQEHWEECEICHAEIEGTRGEHR